MTIDSLRAFIEFARAGSMRAAATRLYCSPRHVARRVAEVEAELALTLRGERTEGQHLSRQGWDVVARACAVICAVERLDGTPPVPGDCVAGHDLPCVGMHDCTGVNGNGPPG